MTQHNVEMLVLIAIINQFPDAQPPHAMPISTDLSLPISLLLFLSFKMPLSHHIAHPSLKPYSAACILQHLAAIAVFLQGIPPYTQHCASQSPFMTGQKPISGPHSRSTESEGVASREGILNKHTMPKFRNHTVLFMICISKPDSTFFPYL